MKLITWPGPGSHMTIVKALHTAETTSSYGIVALRIEQNRTVFYGRVADNLAEFLHTK